jgi:hypothetical protein
MRGGLVPAAAGDSNLRRRLTGDEVHVVPWHERANRRGG